MKSISGKITVVLTLLILGSTTTHAQYQPPGDCTHYCDHQFCNVENISQYEMMINGCANFAPTTVNGGSFPTDGSCSKEVRPRQWVHTNCILGDCSISGKLRCWTMGPTGMAWMNKSFAIDCPIKDNIVPEVLATKDIAVCDYGSFGKVVQCAQDGSGISISGWVQW